MTNHQSDELLREVLDALGEIRGLLASRLPQPAKVEPTAPPTGGVVTRVVTGDAGEGVPVPPVKKTTPKRR